MRSAARVGIVGALVAAVVAAGSTAGATTDNHGPNPLSAIDHIVVIYEENHSFDNLFGSWPGVDGLNKKPGNTPRNTQVDTTGKQLQLSAAEGRQPDVASPAREHLHVASRDGGARSTARSRNQPFQDRRLHRTDRRDVPEAAAGLRVPERAAEG